MSYCVRIFVLLLGACGAINAETHVRLRWELAPESQEFFTEVRGDNRSSPRYFKWNLQKAMRQEIGECPKEARLKTQPRDFCIALKAQIAPKFIFAVENMEKQSLVLESIEVDCFRVFGYRGPVFAPGFALEAAPYDLLLPATVGHQKFFPKREFVARDVGVINLRFSADIERLSSRSSAEMELRFLFHAGRGRYEGRSGRFIISFDAP
jgi:hypothetical protein